MGICIRIRKLDGYMLLCYRDKKGNIIDQASG